MIHCNACKFLFWFCETLENCIQAIQQFLQELPLISKIVYDKNTAVSVTLDYRSPSPTNVASQADATSKNDLDSTRGEETHEHASTLVVAGQKDMTSDDDLEFTSDDTVNESSHTSEAREVIHDCREKFFYLIRHQARVKYQGGYCDILEEDL